ncbi:flagellar hook-length control protein FliK [Leptospira paudalimensis]|uniref:Flagellar hook-length control protein FliK n=1 Tax=Leptospira paudalimensis TaxID=2950024 RepID=A0ABT3M880_9LEPT|nr:flagellar hook-length control protein FliK [Leptospira paudalimensis]MCW7504592.1 flagellar hook-length control protein FliK [Leptospira paudalimensis]
MNVNVDKQNLIPFPQVELRPGKRDGADNNYFAVKESFGEILEREFQIHSEKPNSPSEWKPLQADKNQSDAASDVVSKMESNQQSNSNVIPSNSVNENNTSQKTNEDSKEEISEEEDLDRDALEYSIGILSNQHLFDQKFLPANEGNESLQKEKAVALSMQKSAEKNASYATKEAKTFLDETKKLAESLLQKDFVSSKQIFSHHKQDQLDSIPTNLVMFPGSQKKIQTDKVVNEPKHNPNVISQKKESEQVGLNLVTSFLPREKGSRGLENESPSETSLRKLDPKGKSPKQNKSETVLSESNIEKENSNLSITSDKMVRSLGFKEKEFQKLNENKNQVQNEKIKTDSSFVNQVQTIFSSKMGEENGKSSEDKSNKQGFNLHSVENKLHSKTEDVKNLERNQKPKETNLKQNLDELIKQAKFDIVQNGKSSAEIIMNPKEYGRLTLKVTVDGEKVEGRILVESEELQKSLQNEIQSIKENLKESGLDLQALIIDLWDDGNQFAERQNQNELYQTLMETAKNRGNIEKLEKENGVGLDDISLPPDSKVLEFFA